MQSSALSFGRTSRTKGSAVTRALKKTNKILPKSLAPEPTILTNYSLLIMPHLLLYHLMVVWAEANPNQPT